MSPRKRRGDNTAPSLFPFLAVLLCTIGALILILAITVTNTHASARKDAELAMDEVNDSADFAQVVTEELAAQRETLKSKIERRRRDLADIEDHIERLKKNLEQLLDQMEKIQSQSTDASSTLEDKSQKLASIRQEIDAKKKEILEEIEKQKQRKPAFAIVPYSGNSGTSRRPVYIECTKSGIVLQPEGILISANDLKPPLGPGNPLDAALRVLRIAYQQRDATFGMTQPPYPLLLVRPDGIQTYALAREAMNGWDDQFGYELINADMELKFPMGVPGLREELVRSIELAKQRQTAYLASIPRSIVTRDENWDAIDALNAAGNTQVANGGSSVGNSNTISNASNNDANKEGNGNSNGGGSGSGSEWKLVQGIANEQVFNAIERNGQSTDTASGFNSGSQPTPYQGELDKPLSPSLGKLDGSYVASGSLGPKAIQNGGVTENHTGSSTTIGSGSEGSTSNNPNAPTSHSDQASNGNAAMGSRSANGNQQPAPSGQNAFSSGSATGTSVSDPSSATNATTDEQSQGTPSVSVQKNLASTSAAPKAKYVNPEGDLKPISVSAGKGWAASRAEGKATPVARQIYLVALKDRWLLRSDSSPTSFDANITMDEGPQQAGTLLANAIRKRVDSWGLSLPGGYWAPALTIEAASDAQQSVARLEKLLESSGVDILVTPLKLPNQR